MVYIYTLLLEQEKYYIGKTSNPKFRLESHFNSDGSEWTKIYKPIKILELIPDCDEYDEDKYTRKYMDKFGIDNVRGGSFCQISLSPEVISMLEKMKKTVNDECYNCGQKGHLASNCTEKQEIKLPENIEELVKFSEFYIQKLKDKEKFAKLTDELAYEFMIKSVEERMKIEYKNFRELDQLKREKQGYILRRSKKIKVCVNDIILKNYEEAEKNRIKLQKERNSEYLPILESMLKAIKILNQ
jgi:hypothetical protein